MKKLTTLLQVITVPYYWYYGALVETGQYISLKTLEGLLFWNIHLKV